MRGVEGLAGVHGQVGAGEPVAHARDEVMDVAELALPVAEPLLVGFEEARDRGIAGSGEVPERLEQSHLRGVGTTAVGLVADVVLDLVPDVRHHRADLDLAAGAAEVVVDPREVLVAQEHLAVGRPVELRGRRIELVLGVDVHARAARPAEELADPLPDALLVLGPVCRDADAGEVADAVEDLIDRRVALVRPLGETLELPTEALGRLGAGGHLRADRVALDDSRLADVGHPARELDVAVAFPFVARGRTLYDLCCKRHARPSRAASLPMND